MDEEIVQYMRRRFNLLIGERSAEMIKTSIGCAYPETELKKVEVKGRDLISVFPKLWKSNSEEIREAIMEPVSLIVDAVRMPWRIHPRSWLGILLTAESC